MRQSKLFTKTRREAPRGEVAKNAALLIRGGFVHKEMAGVYSYLPLGLRVLSKIKSIVREEMNRIGGQEVFLSTLQEKRLWEQSGRWSDEAVDTWFKTALKGGTELALGFTHEEPLTAILREHVSSYRDLPKYIYQIQTKFRNELRAKSGLMRGREFLMKDLYSFSRDEKEHDEFYENVKQAYQTIFGRVGIGEETYLTFASGGTFSQYSHEFQTITPSGEDVVYIDEAQKIAVNKEVLNASVIADLGLTKDRLFEKNAVEVGNIFSLGTKFSEALGLLYRDKKGSEQLVVMGSYGIGLGRLMGTVVEIHSDEEGIVWPASIAPFGVHMIEIGGEKTEVNTYATRLYRTLKEAGIEVLYDDRGVSTGEKFADADLIGIPIRVVVSEKTIEKDVVEVKKRIESEAKILSRDEFIKSLIAE